MKNYIIDCKFVFFVKFKSLELFIAEIGKIYNILNIKETSLVQIPKHIRMVDKKLKSIPIYEIELKEEEYSIGMAEEAIIISIKNNQYTSWKNSFKKFLENLMQIFNFNSIIKIDKISLQYIDFFEFNIFEKGQISCNNLDINEKIFFKSDYGVDGIGISKILTNEAKFREKNGSVVDITTTTIFNKQDFVNLIDILHDKNIEEFKKVVPNEIIRELRL